MHLLKRLTLENTVQTLHGTFADPTGLLVICSDLTIFHPAIQAQRNPPEEKECVFNEPLVFVNSGSI